MGKFYLPEFAGPIHLPSIVPYVAILVWIGLTLGVMPLLTYMERVIIAFIQDRSGPNRVGPRGILQAVADGAKSFFKEDVTPKSADKFVYYLAPMVAIIATISAGSTIPIHEFYFLRGAHLGQAYSFTGAPDSLIPVPLAAGNVNIGLLFILALSSLEAYGVVLAGWSSNNKYSLLGGLRASAQLISYELAMGLSLLCVVVMAGSLQLDHIVQAQNQLPFPGAPEFLRGSVFSWYWIQTFFVPVIIYTIAMIAETNRAPFDLPEAEAELVAGFMTEYSSMKYAMFFISEYIAMITVSCLNATVFWGGTLPPLNIVPFTLVPGIVWFVLKMLMGIFLYIWLRGTLPRLRYDVLMSIGWKKLLPLGLFWLFLLAGYSLARETIFPKATPTPVAQTSVARTETGR